MYLPTMLPVTRGAIKVKGADNFSLTIKYKVFDCWHKGNENLVPTPTSSCQRFAVMYRGVFDLGLMDSLEHAYRLGGISSVKLIDVNKRSLYIFLDAKVASSSVAAIENAWTKVHRSGRYGHWKVHFASESEIWSGRSDYDFLSAAKEVLESHKLGIVDSSTPTPHVVNFNNFWGDASNKRPSVERPVHAPLPTTVVRRLYSAVQFISYLQKRKITEGNFRLSECTKKQLHLLKIALELVTGLRLPGESVDWSLAVRSLCETLGDDSFIKKMEASLGHKSQSSKSDYSFPRTAMGVCSNSFSSKQIADQAHYLRCVECTGKTFPRKNKAHRT
ncbi:hypothetical protein D3C84_435230 [compost metagenome]